MVCMVCMVLEYARFEIDGVNGDVCESERICENGTDGKSELMFERSDDVEMIDG